MPAVDWEYRSTLRGIEWPAIPAPGNTAALALLLQLEGSQWLPPEQLLARQLTQMQILMQHANTSVPFYRNHWRSSLDPSRPLSLEAIAALPVLTRRDLQENFDSLISSNIPAAHGATSEARSSGSTGTPVRMLSTGLTALLWNVFTLRDHRWHRRDLGGKLAAIRHGVPHGISDNWGRATRGLVHTGPALTATLDVDVAVHLRWLQQHQPDYLMTYPSMARDLARLAIEQGDALESLREVRTFGELLPPEARALCRQAWGVPVIDNYSGVETGYIALQCPEHEHYHIQSEGLFVEILDAQGRPCRAGETGRVVITTLHNFAMPLIRYDIGDYAELGEPCSCGRGLPVLKRILGRVRNILVTPAGERYWPAFGSRAIATIGSIVQHQMAQIAPDHIEARLVTRAPLTVDEETRLRALILSRLPAGLRLSIAYTTHIPRGPTGKFEDFISYVAPGSF
jgi:phenylacetate-CoA ligase